MNASAYLSFDGTCREALEFYATALHGEVQTIMTYGNSPMGAQMPPETQDWVIHGRVKVGSTLIMGSDAPPGRFQPMTGARVVIETDDPEEAERAFAALSEGGGTVEMPLAETWWAQRFGMMTDRFGTGWMVNCSKPM